MQGDPKQCLIDASYWIKADKPQYAHDLLNGYTKWRRLGGHEPDITLNNGLNDYIVKGDAYHTTLVARYADICKGHRYWDGKLDSLPEQG